MIENGKFIGDHLIAVDKTRSGSAVGKASAATGHPLATQAAMEMLVKGGSVIDAAVASQAVLSLVEPHASGFGGGALLVYQGVDMPNPTVLDGLSASTGVAPERLERDFDGEVIPKERADFGGRTVGVPGGLKALGIAHSRYGKLAWNDLFAPAIALAEDGFPMSPYLWRMLLEMPAVRDIPFAKAAYCQGNDFPVPVGSKLRNGEFASSLRKVAKEGASALYCGELAREIVHAVNTDLFPGVMRESDLSNYLVIERAPLSFPLGGHTVYTAPAPCYGGFAVGQIVGLAARHGVASLGEYPSEQEIHVLAEAGRLALADRAVYAADPEHVHVPDVGLLDDRYLDERASLIHPYLRAKSVKAGAPDGGELAASATSHAAFADQDGNVLSITMTINQNFGARINVGGFWLNNVLTNFAQHPVIDGQRVANSAAPNKRPRTSIAPCVIADASGRAVGAIGAGGGNRIIGHVANALLRFAGGQRDAQKIVSSAHALNWNGPTEIEPCLAAIAPALAKRGHWVLVKRLDGGTQCVLYHNGQWVGGADPRRDGLAMALSK